MSGCSDTCSCAVVAGDGAKVTGSGSPTNPYRISVDVPNFSSAFAVDPSDTIDFDLVGAGTLTDPLRLTGNVTMSMRDLTDVSDTAVPSVGDVPVWVSSGGVSGWQFQPPPTVAPGTINIASTGGLAGDGSGGAPLRVSTSGIWGVNVGSGVDSTIGQAIYIDSNNQLRAAPAAAPESIAWDSLSGKPTVFPSRWDLVQQRPTTFDSTWDKVANKPNVSVVGHNHDTRYYTQAQSVELFVQLRTPANRFFSGTPVLDITAANQMGLRWNGSHPVIRVDNSEWELPFLTDVVAVRSYADTIGASIGNKVDGYLGDNQSARFTQGPTSNAYNRGVGGGGFFNVWMDSSLQFGRNTSSRRFKEDIEYVDIPLDDTLRLARMVATYHRIGEGPEREIGMIAEEVNEVFPGAVTWYKDPGDPDAEPVIDGLRYDLLALPALAALVTLDDRLRAIEARLGLEA